MPKAVFSQRLLCSRGSSAQAPIPGIRSPGNAITAWCRPWPIGCITARGLSVPAATGARLQNTALHADTECLIN